MEHVSWMERLICWFGFHMSQTTLASGPAGSVWGVDRCVICPYIGYFSYGTLFRTYYDEPQPMHKVILNKIASGKVGPNGVCYD